MPTLGSQLSDSIFVGPVCCSRGDIAIRGETDYVGISIGSDTHVLTADSTQPYGVKWAAAQGIQGNTGATGNTGSQGIQGNTGGAGQQGPQGDAGSQGPMGNTGSQGVQGNTGAQGNTGSQGIQGNTGATGNTGSQGIQGNTGAQGNTGSPGGGGGSDPWTYLKVAGISFTTTSATAVDVTGLSFTPTGNSVYEFLGVLMVQTILTTVNPRIGLAWPTGMSNGVAMIEEAQAVNTVPITANGNIGASLLIGVGGLPANNASQMVRIKGMLEAGASPGSSLRVQLASETAGTAVRVMRNSFLRYRTI